MSASTEESLLARQMCLELLSASNLKALCRARGFPLTGKDRETLADTAAARFLTPGGVPEAMSQFDGVWLVALHLIAAAREPVPLLDLAPVIAPDSGRMKAEPRALWTYAQEHLLSKGVLLADQEATPSRWEKSKFARIRLRLPRRFYQHLPPFPIAAEPISQGAHGSRQKLFSAALSALVAGEASTQSRRTLDLVHRFTAHLTLVDGRLGLRGVVRPTAEHLEQMLYSCWEAGLRHHQTSAPVTAGSLCGHILFHIPLGHGTTPAALEQALGSLAAPTRAQDIAAFCEEGAEAGLLARQTRGKAGLLYGATSPAQDAAGGLALSPHKGGVRVDPRGSALLPVLQAAAVSLATIEGQALVLVPDSVRLGRDWAVYAQDPTLATLRAASPAFEAACKNIEQRRGQVLVHRGLLVLRVADAGLVALLRRRFGAAVREVAGEYLAMPSGMADDLLAYIKKEGYVARREA